VSAIILADVAKHTDVLRIACTRCDRADSYPVRALLWRYGRYAKVPDLLRRLSTDCLRRQSRDPHDEYIIHCPDIAELFLSKSRLHG
jgi:hypothetical protein